MHACMHTCGEHLWCSLVPMTFVENFVAPPPIPLKYLLNGLSGLVAFLCEGSLGNGKCLALRKSLNNSNMSLICIVHMTGPAGRCCWFAGVADSAFILVLRLDCKAESPNFVTNPSLVQNWVSFVYPKGKEEKLGFILFSMMIRVSCSTISRRGRPILLLFSWESWKGEWKKNQKEK